MAAGPHELAGALPDQLRDMPMAQVEDVICRAHPGVWAERKRHFVNAAFHWEWYELVLRGRRECIVAPREHAKSEVITINQTVWRSIYQPGIWTYAFTNTGPQAKILKERIDAAMDEVRPDLLAGATTYTTTVSVYANGSRLDVASAGQSVRGPHPDIIVGDDVLEEQTCLTSYQRKKTNRWWLGTVGNMAHAPTMRRVQGELRSFPATRIFLVGTPFHSQDLLMSMKTNPLYRYRRYAAEIDPAQRLEDSWAVEAA